MSRPKGSAEELERRRRLAVARVQEGYKQKEVARFLGVHPSTVSDWVRAHRRGGERALESRPLPGRAPKLSGDQEREVLRWLTHSPTAFGFATELWTAPRVARLIERRFGVRFHPRSLNHWLRRRGVSPQKPERRARERDAAEIQRWRAEDWPRIQKKGGGGGRTCWRSTRRAC